MHLNKVTLIGTVGAVYPTNPSFCTLSLATRSSWKDKETQEWKSETEWHKVVCGSYNAEKALKLEKGDEVYVEGTIKTSKFTNQAGVEKEYKDIKCFHMDVIIRKADKIVKTKATEQIDNDPIPF